VTLALSTTNYQKPDTQSRACSQLGPQMSHVNINRLLGDIESLGKLHVGYFSENQQFGNLPLTRGDLVQVGKRVPVPAEATYSWHRKLPPCTDI
jgi:hypothetical protein